MAIPGSFFQLQISRILSDVFEVLLSATVAGNSCSHLRDGDFIADSNVDWSRSSFQSHGSSMILTMPVMVLKVLECRYIWQPVQKPGLWPPMG
jgi:hypothetical protein